MIYGLYLSAQGAENQSIRQDVIANNLANTGTTAFKRGLALFRAHPPYDISQGSGANPAHDLLQSTGGTTPRDIVTDFSNGPLIATGGSLDFAIQGPGFFRVVDPQGNEFLTRNGNFTLTRDGELVTSSLGYRVLNNNGQPIVVPPGSSDIFVGENGNIQALTADGIPVPIGRLDLSMPAELNKLEKIGNSLYRAHGDLDSVDAKTVVKQGFTEGSGTNSVKEMLAMVEASRFFETNVNMIKYQDDALGRLLQSMSPR